MIKYENKKTYYTTDIIVDVTCDDCGVSMIGDDDFITEITTNNLYCVDNESTGLDSTGFSKYTLHLCEKCATPILLLMHKIDSSIII